MDDVFHVGEIAVYANFEHWTEYNGVECEIVGGLELRMASRRRAGLPPIECMAYATRASDGEYFTVPPRRLRKKNPPLLHYDGRHVGRWAECPWQPSELLIIA